MGKPRKTVKDSKLKLQKKLTATTSLKVSKKQRNSKLEKKLKLKKELKNVKDCVEKSNLDYDEIKERLSRPYAVKEPLKQNVTRRRQQIPVDLENSFDQIEKLCRTNINISE